MFVSRQRVPSVGLIAAVGIGAALWAVASFGVCVLAMAYGAETLAVTTGALAVAAVLVTMASLEFGDGRAPAALPPVLGVAAADTV